MNDGGPAYPCEGGERSGLHPNSGMTLRDHFAGRFLSGMAPAAINDFAAHEGDVVATIKVFNNVATIAYGMADAMLVARDKK